MTLKKDIDKYEINTNNNNNNAIINKEKEVRKKKKKSSYTTEKELQIAFEKKFLENINKEYSDKEYEEDMKQCLKDKRKKFMKDNFPIMFKKDKFYLYSKLKKKRLASRDYFIETDFFEKNKNDNNLEIYFNNSSASFNLFALIKKFILFFIIIFSSSLLKFNSLFFKNPSNFFIISFVESRSFL